MISFMSNKMKGTGVLLCLVGAGLLFPGLPWSATNRHRLKKIVAKAEIKLSNWLGNKPRLISIAGETGTPGARVQALDSPSGWATFCDAQGRFTLPDVLWYPCATYELVVSTDENTGKIVTLSAPPFYPSTGVMQVGNLPLQSARQVNVKDMPGDTSYTYEYFDLQNRDYYRSLFEEITLGKKTAEEKVEAVNRYIAERLNYRETQFEIGSPRRIIEVGSQYCGHLGDAMATLLAVAYPVRTIHLTDGATPANTHVVVEVFYDYAWHLYDPTFGVRFKDRDGKVVSYSELIVNPDLVSLDGFSAFQQKYPKIALRVLPDIYTSGHHHYYYLAYKCSQYAHAWWEYKNGVDYVSAGDSILLTAAGIRTGTHVTYHIRKPGNQEDELTLVSRQVANSYNVLNEEESPPIHLAPGLYEIFVDLYDGNIVNPENASPALITNWNLGLKLEVRGKTN
jgi:hypothetical protein